MQDGLIFIMETVQGKRKKPKKYRHFVRIPASLYNDLVADGVIIPESFWIEESAFFEYNDSFVTISFITYWHVEDVHIKILDYLVRKSNGGKSPVERGGSF
jgi:hypothetical protein